MRLLLDAHAFLWFVMGDARLTSTARAAILDRANEKRISAATVWEMAIKTSLGKLTLSEPFDVLVPRELKTNGFQILPLELGHFSQLLKLPLLHRDPFDRIIAAQALYEQMSVVSADGAMDLYGVPRIW